MKHVVTALSTVLLGSLLMFAGPVPSAAAHHCTGTAVGYDDGGSVSAECHGQAPGESASTVAGWSDADRYAYFCGGAFEGLSSVVVERIGPATQAFVESRGYDPTGEYDMYAATCFDSAGVLRFRLTYGVVVTPPVDPTVLRDRALARVAVPAPSVGSFPDGGRPALVQGDTWFWIEDPWDPLVEAETQGFTTVSVSATPERVEWRPGDREVLVCHGPGDVWREGLYERGSSCSHVYTASSADQPGDVYAGSATVFWELTWSINGAPQGSFGTVSQTSSFTMPAAEVQVVES